MTTYTISKQFATKVDRTRRVLECAEAFGLGLDDKAFVLYDNLKIDVNPGDVVYITGQSGSGKSVLLRELASQMMAEGLKVGRIEDVQVEDAALLEQVGTSTESACQILSAAGLNDAYLFIRKPGELSDGQLYRLKIAKLISEGYRVICADEFGAVLDRTTAKVVAYNLQKQARMAGVTVIVATTHKDLIDELGPDLLVEKRFRERVLVRSGLAPGRCPLCTEGLVRDDGAHSQTA